jgi:hypothetical protein
MSTYDAIRDCWIPNAVIDGYGFRDDLRLGLCCEVCDGGAMWADIRVDDSRSLIMCADCWTAHKRGGLKDRLKSLQAGRTIGEERRDKWNRLRREGLKPEGPQ